MTISPAAEDQELTLTCLKEELIKLVNREKIAATRLEMFPTDEKLQRTISTLNALIDYRQKIISHVEAFDSEIGAVIAAGGFRTATFGGSSDWCADWALYDVIDKRKGPNKVRSRLCQLKSRQLITNVCNSSWKIRWVNKCRSYRHRLVR